MAPWRPLAPPVALLHVTAAFRLDAQDTGDGFSAADSGFGTAVEVKALSESRSGQETLIGY